MLALFDNLLRDLLIANIGGLGTNQVRFQPPDKDWRTYVTGLGALNALNIYLVDTRENRKLRSNERVRSVENGWVREDPAPARIDCHFLISAWSPAAVTPAIEPALDEHALLYQVVAVLLRWNPLSAAGFYPAGSAPLLQWPARFRETELPLTILPTEGFPKYAEFWGTMGDIHPWRPAVYLVATLPVALPREVSGPMVTTRITEYRLAQSGAPGDVWVQIGGTVRDGAGQPVPGAWVGLERSGGALFDSATADAQGRFDFNWLRVGDYVLRGRATGYAEAARPISVPAPSGEYDLQLV
jgi:hypothetical protein